MKKRYVTLAAVFLLASLQMSFTEANEFADSTNEFALEIYRKLTKNSKNVIFSPISISLAVAMTSLGARGNTLNEMMTTLRMNKFDNRRVHEWLRDFKNGLNRMDVFRIYRLYLVNNIFKQKEYKYLETFLKGASDYYRADIRLLDFRARWEDSRRSINDMVSNSTNNKINDLFPPGSINMDTKLVLTSAIYFKGDWMKQFSTENTHPNFFSGSDGNKVLVWMMHDKLEVEYTYSNDLRSQVLELPYKGGTLSMVIILPSLKKTSLEQVERSLTPSKLSNFHTYKTEVKIWLPKFKLESSFNLVETLKELGMRDLFNPSRADLSGIDGSKGLFVSDVVHKAFINVDEHGTEAAAATGDSILRVSAQLIPTFKADHPFIYFIRDNASKTILFLGRLDRPSIIRESSY